VLDSMQAFMLWTPHHRLMFELVRLAPFRSTKAAIKLHTLLDLRGAIPAFIHISDGKLHDVNVLDILLVEAGSFYIMDRGYLDFVRARNAPAGASSSHAPTEHGCAARVFVSVDRASESSATSASCSTASTRQGIIRSSAPHSLPRPRDRQDAGLSDQQHRIAALTIAALYKSRWQVELFFKWIKQHLRIKRFWPPARTREKQIWCAIATYVLIAIVKKELKLDASLYTCLQILSVSIFEKTEISCAFSHISTEPTNLLSLTN